MSEPAAPATSATLTLLAHSDSVTTPAATITATVGETVKVAGTLTPVGGAAYGFTGAFSYSAASLQFVSAEWTGTSAGLPALSVQDSATPGTLRVSVDSDGATPVVSADQPQTIAFTFKVRAMGSASAGTATLSFGGSTTANRVALLVDPTARIADLINPTTGAYYTKAQTPAAVDAKVVAVAAATTATVNIASGFGVVLAADSSNGAVSTATSTANPLELKVNVGQAITFKATISATTPGAKAYGFSTAFYRSGGTALQLDAAAFAVDNPGLTVDTTENPYYVRVYADSDGSTALITPDKPLTITLKLLAKNMYDGTVNMQIGGKASAFRLSLLTDPSARIADLKDTATPPAYITSPDNLPQTAKDKTVFYEKAISYFRFTTVSGLTTTLVRDPAEIGSDGKGVPVHVGQRATLLWTINSDADAYGFAASFDIPKALELDAAALATDNPGTPVRADLTGDYARVIWESDGATKAVTAGTPRVIRIKLKLKQTTPYDLNVNVYGYGPVTVFTDPTVRALGDAGVFGGAVARDWQPKIQAAEAAGKVKVANTPAYPGVAIKAAYDANVAFSTETGLTGTNPQPITVKATFTGPTDKAVYGLSMGVTYSGGYIVLDQAATAAANPGVSVGFGDVSSPTSMYGGTVQLVYVESDGTTPIAAAGGTFQLKLVYVPTTTAGAGSSAISAATTAANGRVALLTDPSLRVKAAGTGLTTLNFLGTAIDTAEIAGKVVIGSATAGKVTTTARWTDLTLDASGYYSLPTPEAVAKFANHVNVDGDNTIKGNFTAKMTLTECGGIGTAQYPYRGQLTSSSTGNAITLACNVTSGADRVVGGLVDHLGSGGLITNMTVNGTLNVSGTTGYSNIGGYVGRSDGGTVAYVTNNAAITVAPGVRANVGGVVGSITRAASTSATTAYTYALYQDTNGGAVSGGTYTGGLVGLFAGVPGDTSIAGTVTLGSNSGAVGGGSSVGGIVGRSIGGVVNASGNGVWVTSERKNGGAITGSDSVGGVVGSAVDTAIRNGFDTGPVSDGRHTGGILGLAEGDTSVTESWNGTSASVSSAVPEASVGGIIGAINSADVSATYNFTLGSLSASGAAAHLGGVVGRARLVPAKYKGNHYLATSATADGLDRMALNPASGPAGAGTAAQFLFTGASSSSPGKYLFQPAEPAKDPLGVYLLTSVDDLLWFANTVTTNAAATDGVDGNEISAKLLSDIDLSDEQFSAIGGSTATKQFKGVFDGGGHTVTLNLTGTQAAFFSYVGPTGEVRNLTIAGKVTGDYVAGITYVLAGGKLTNCVNTATITGNVQAAGVAVQVQGGTLTSCKNTGAVSAPTASAGGGGAGGIAFQVGGKSSFISCENSGDVTAPSTAGGIAAMTTQAGIDPVTFTDCVNTGKVTSTGTPANNNLSIQTYFSAGGILGMANAGQPVVIVRGVNRGDIAATMHAGGILGGYDSGTSSTSAVTITDSKNYGNIKLTYSGSDQLLLLGMGAGGIAGVLNVGFTAEVVNGVWTEHEAPISVHGNYNEGNVDGGLGSRTSSIVGAAGSGANYDNTMTNNSSTVLFGNDAANTRIIKVEPTTQPTTPGGGTTTPGGGDATTPGDGGTTTPGGEATTQPPGQETPSGTSSGGTVTRDASSNATTQPSGDTGWRAAGTPVPLALPTEEPTTQEMLPTPDAPSVTAEQPQKQANLDVPAQVTEVAQPNVLPAVLTIGALVAAAAVMVFVGLRRRRS